MFLCISSLIMLYQDPEEYNGKYDSYFFTSGYLFTNQMFPCYRQDNILCEDHIHVLLKFFCCVICLYRLCCLRSYRRLLLIVIFLQALITVIKRRVTVNKDHVKAVQKLTQYMHEDPQIKHLKFDG
jgi:hypothetical protein